MDEPTAGDTSQPPEPGEIDETARLFLANERPLAEYLASRGAKIVAVAVSPMRRTPDAMVDGEPVEFKTLRGMPNSKTILNTVGRALQREGQAPTVFIDVRSTPVTESEARRALVRVGGVAYFKGKLDRLRIIGNGFDIEQRYDQA
jgi:hypothetical protein